jgi:predicted small integral membrane protein
VDGPGVVKRFLAQRKAWNGQAAAFRFYLTILAILVFVNQKDGELVIRKARE